MDRAFLIFEDLIREGKTVATMDIIIPTITRTTAISMRVNPDGFEFLLIL
jgi:hypothetical protein